MARKVDCPGYIVNSVGGNDELVFDGFSLSLNANGELITSSRSFAEAIEVHDLTDESVCKHKDVLPEENLRKALVLGLRDYAHKSGFSKGLIGLSGGIDSAVTAALATEALGADNVIGISLPSAISSDHSKDDARDLAPKPGDRVQYPAHSENRRRSNR